MIHFVFILLIFFTAITPVSVNAIDEPLSINSVSAMLIVAQRGQTLYAKQEKEHLHVAIASRLMTVLLAMENAKPGAMITASNEAATVDGALLKLRIGEKYDLTNLAYAVILSGANDAAIALSEYLGGSVTDFVEMMNTMSEKLGMEDTHFTNPTGFADDNQYTTAADLAIFMQYALTNSGFSRIFSTQAKPWYDDRKTSLLTNRNTMFWSFDGTDGGINGSSDPSLESCITTATRNKMRLICIILEVSTTSRNVDSTNLLNHGFTNYRFGTLVAAGQVLKTVAVNNQTLNLLAKTDTFYVYPIGQSFVAGMNTTVDDASLKPPLLKSTSIGKAIFTLVDKTVIEVDLMPEKDILPNKTKWELLKEKLKTNQELLYLIGLLIAIELMWLLYSMISAIYRFFTRRKRWHT